MGAHSGTGRKFKPEDAVMMEADVAARAGLDGFLRRRPLQIPGAMNRLSAFLLRFVPRSLAAGLAERAYAGALLPEHHARPERSSTVPRTPPTGRSVTAGSMPGNPADTGEKR